MVFGDWNAVRAAYPKVRSNVPKKPHIETLTPFGRDLGGL